jgi:DNA-binding response OmpR family regulator
VPGTAGTSKRVLVLENDPRFRDQLTFLFRDMGYRVLVATDASEALKRAVETRIDAAVVDLRLGNLTGIQIANLLSQLGPLPVFMMIKPAGNGTPAAVQLEPANYLPAPLALGDLLERGRSLLEAPAPAVDADRIGRLRIDRAGRRIFIDDLELHLSPKEWDLLVYLVSRPGHVVSRKELLRELWQKNHVKEENTVKVHVRWLRQKFEMFDHLGFRIVTVRGSGYRLDINRSLMLRHGR